MDLPIALFLGFIAMILAIVVFGIIRKMPVMIFIGGILLVFWGIMTDSIIMDNQIDTVQSIPQNVTTQTENNTITYSYNYEAQSGTSQLNLGGNIAYGEYASTGSSLLVGDTINCMDLYLKKTGSPTGTMTIGRLNSTGFVTTTFGTQDVSLLTTANKWHTYCLSGSSTYTILNGDRMGARYNGGDASNGVGFNRDTTGTFDSTITFQQTYTSSWASGTGTDSSMRLYLVGQDLIDVTFEADTDTYTYDDTVYLFTEIPKVMFAFFGMLIMLVSIMLGKYQD